MSKCIGSCGKLCMHQYIVGKSGSGKSTFLLHQVLANEDGFAVLDPHGDLAERIADTIPCIYWDTSDTDHVSGFNPLANVPEAQRHLVADQVVVSFKAIWGDSWGPRMEWILYNAVRLLLDNHGTLLDIPQVLTDGKYRMRLLRKASFRSFWENEFAEWEERYRNDAVAPVLNKVGQFVANPVLHNILSHSTINISRVMETGERLVVNLSKGRLGATPSHLLGALLVSAISQAAQARAAIPPEERRPFTLYADEFQNFATDSFASILSEARKFNLSLVTAHQFLGQVPELLRQAVFGNAGRIASFRVAAEDAALIAAELGLKNPDMLVDLPPFNAWERSGPDPHHLTVPPAPATQRRLERNRARARANYARPRAMVEHGGA